MDPLSIPYNYQACHQVFVYTILLIGGVSIAFVIINESDRLGSIKKAKKNTCDYTKYPSSFAAEVEGRLLNSTERMHS